VATVTKLVVGVADYKISATPGDEIITHGLGSCLGITANDPIAGVGGLLHVMLPASNVNPEKAKSNPYMFVDSGVPIFFKALYEAGAQKGRLIIKVAGGAQIRDKDDFFAIGKRNYIIMRKLFWKNGIMISSEDVGGNVSRTMRLSVGSGEVTLTIGGEDKPL
jgi:chemotaxis protein CheD